ncbi:MAG: hypothetical protein KKB30_08550 [Proteobacteria bacterium]|nr:hypothetical protein [Pseudomonadota bacterium]MBU1716929.1 hypothetical protein [Pseudomonadota bacterium]
MSLADFWDNITTPGFISATIDEFKMLFSQIKKEATELFEEGEEILTDGFMEMLIKDNSNYKTSMNMRSDGKEIITALKTICLDKRGIDSGSLPVMMLLDLEFMMIINSLAEFADDQTAKAVNELQNEFKHLEFLRPSGLENFRVRANKLIEVPEAPVYEAPTPNEHIKRLGPVSIFTSDKQKRIAAAGKYFEQVSQYQMMMDVELSRQDKAGVIFDSSVLANGVGELILNFGHRYWQLTA